MSKRVRGGPPDDYERRQSEIVGRRAKDEMDAGKHPGWAASGLKSNARLALMRGEDQMSISASKNREDPAGADGYAKGGVVGYRSPAMTKSVNMHGRGGKGC